MKLKYTVVSVSFFALLFAVGLCAFLLPHRSFSENENRTLADKVEVPGLSDLVNGTWQTDLENFFSDQFLGRDLLCQIGSESKILCGARERNGAYIAKNGVLTECVKTVDRAQYTENLQKLQAFCRSHENVSVLLVPSGADVQSDLLPAFAETYPSDSLFAEASETLAGVCTFVDVRADFADKEGLYYKTDHHWTYRGAFLAYEVFCRLNGQTAYPFEHEKVADNFYGTLWSKTLNFGQPSDEIYAPTVNDALKEQLYDSSACTKKDKYTFFLGGNEALKTVENTEAETDKTLLLIKDSFANSFVPYLTKNYCRVILVDLRYYNGRLSKLMEEENVSDILVLYSMTSFSESHDLGRLKL